MVDILIMDDKPEKLEAIKNVVKEAGVSAENIQTADTISKGRRLLCNKYYDLLILDLVLPLYEDSQEADNIEAPNFIDEIYENPRIMQPNQIIGITAYDEEYSKLKKQFEDKVWALVKYSNIKIDWKTMLKNKVFHLIRSKKNLLSSIENKHHYQIGIICALQEEFKAFMEAFEAIEWTRQSIEGISVVLQTGKITSGTGEQYSICAACVGRPGMVATAALATCMYEILGVKNLFMIGIAAGFKSNDLQRGDIVVARSSQDYSSGKIVDGKDKRIAQMKEIQQVLADNNLLNIAGQLAEDREELKKINDHMASKHLQSERDIKVHVAATACGPYVVASSDVINEIKGLDRKFKALDMEGYGLYYASYYCKKAALWIKGISDYADEQKDDSYHERAAYGSAYFLYRLIKEMM